MPHVRFDDEHLLRAFESNGRDDPALEAELDEEFPLGDGTAETETTVSCPYCGESGTIGLDPGSGAIQDYVEDCEVCCQPWRVVVAYHPDGSADVSVQGLDQ